MASVFTKIVRGELPCHRVYEDEDHLAFLALDQIQRGHTLVIPKQETDYLFDMDADAYDALWRAVRKVEAGLRAATGCARVVVIVVGYEVPHVHIHLVPTSELGDYPVPPVHRLETEDAAALATQLRAAVA